jgi:hypothetical protein
VARVQIPVTSIVKTGVAQPAQTNGDSTNNHYFTNDGVTFIEIVSSDASSQDITIHTGKTVDGYALANQTITVTAGATKYVGPFTTGTFNQSGTTQVYVDTPVSTTIKFRAYTIA